MDMTRVGGSMDMTRAGGIMDMTKVDDNLFADEVGCRMDTDYVSKTGGAMDMFTARFKNRLNSTNFGNSTSYANDINMDLTKPANNFQSMSCYREPVAKDGEADDNMEMTGVIKLNQPNEENIKYSETSSSPEPIEVGEDSVFERASPNDVDVVSLHSQPRIEDLPGSGSSSANNSLDYGGATATVKFSVLSLANNTLLLPRKESEEDEMTSCPVQFISYDPSKPVNSVTELFDASRPVSVSPQPMVEEESQKETQQDKVDDVKEVSMNLETSKQAVNTQESTHSLATPSPNIASGENIKSSDESGWETMHSMIGLPPTTEPSMTPDVQPSKLVLSRRSRLSAPSPVEEEVSPEPEKTQCLGGLMMQGARKFDADLTTFAPPEESTRAINFALSTFPHKDKNKVVEESPELLVTKVNTQPNLELGDITTFSPDEESTRAVHKLVKLPAVRAAVEPVVIPEQDSPLSSVIDQVIILTFYLTASKPI